MIIVAGEALIDLILEADGRLSAVPGGGPFNTARTIGRLGGRVGFLGRISIDGFGARLRSELRSDKVDVHWVVSTDAPTTLAVAELDGHGVAQYRFYLAGTAAPGLQPADVLAALRTPPEAFHLGTIGLVAEPIGTSLTAGLGHVGPSTLVMVDPNCRPQVILDREAYLHRLRAVLARADVVKVSVDDLGFIAPGEAPEAAARALVAMGPSVVLLTDGARPVHVVADGFAFDVPVPVVEVVDTVGSGDAFGGAFLARFMERSGERAGLREVALVRDAVERAIEVASLTCQRPGADPPRRDEVAWPAL